MRRITVFALVLVVLVIPVAVTAVGGTFTDDDSSIFEADIEWMVNAGVTKGCGPDLFCPKDNVTREQMAAFMRRFARFLEAEDGVVAAADHATQAGHATEADYSTGAAYAAEADHAIRADLATDADYSAEAANAGTLDGLDSSAFSLNGHDHSAYSPQAFFEGGDQSVVLESTDFAILRSISFTPPVDGVVIANSSLTMYAVGDLHGETVECSISEEGLWVDYDYLQEYRILNGAPPAVMAGTRGFDVTGGVPFTVTLNCGFDWIGPPPDYLQVEDSSLTAIYIPNT